jgi:aspartate carbamoyltransferase regulatory subunit
MVSAIYAPELDIHMQKNDTQFHSHHIQIVLNVEKRLKCENPNYQTHITNHRRNSEWHDDITVIKDL